jgi:hypothetical protein
MFKFVFVVLTFVLCAQIALGAFPTVPFGNRERVSTARRIQTANVVSATQTACTAGNKQALESRLASFTADGEASVFAVLTPSGDYKFYSTGPVVRGSTLRFGSITKIFVGYLALNHGLNLTDSPVDYGFNPNKYSGSDIQTFQDLGAHKSGIQEYATAQNLLNDDFTDWRYGGNFTVKRDINLGWKEKPLDFIPTTKYCYSNTNCEVVGDVLETITGKAVKKLIAETFDGILIDNGKKPLSAWPQTPVYLEWPYPTTMPGVSGTLIGTPEGLLRSYKTITQSSEFQTMQNWQYYANNASSVTQCAPGSVGYNIAGGDRYGFFMQHFGADQIYDGLTESMTSVLPDNGSVGHDGDLIVRSILIAHPTGNLFFYHYTNSIDNTELQRRLSTLVTEYLVY